MMNASTFCNMVKSKFEALDLCFSEKSRRLWAATEALSYGRGGIVLVCRATGLSRSTIHNGLKEIQSPILLTTGRVRQVGGGRKKISQSQRGLRKQLKALIEPNTRGDPEKPLLWTSKSVRNLQIELEKRNHKISHVSVAKLLREYGYSLQANKKILEGASHADRDAQFHYINESIVDLQKRGQPVISVDTKKKENLGNFKNNGKELCEKGKPLKVNCHDFPDKKLGKVVPYGVYDVGMNKGWVSVGVSSDTAEFAVNSIRTWWLKMGKAHYPNATELLITADCGGSNGYRVKLWKFELSKFADELGLKIYVRHLPPRTSKWNKIEHRLFSYISKNWRGKPLLTKEMVVNLIANTTTKKGLKIVSVLDENEYIVGKGNEITEEEMSLLNICGDAFHPEWNYTIVPKPR